MKSVPIPFVLKLRFLLLVCCATYIVFSLNSSSRKVVLYHLQVLHLADIFILSAGSLANVNKPVLSYTLVGIAMVCVNPGPVLIFMAEDLPQASKDTPTSPLSLCPRVECTSVECLSVGMPKKLFLWFNIASTVSKVIMTFDLKDNM